MLHTYGEGLVFTACVVFTVTTLVTYGKWIEQGSHQKFVNRVGLLLGAIFLAGVAAGGFLFLAAGHPTFLALSLFLTGSAGAGILISLRMKAPRQTDIEMRRITAKDL